MKTVRRRGIALVVLLPVLIGMAGCGAKQEPEPGKAVYGRPLAEQFQAATDSTQGAGSAAFVASLTYGTKDGDVVQRTQGVLDYAGWTARATLGFDAPSTLPEETLDYIRGGTGEKQELATADEDVYVRGSGSGWLRYTPEAVNRFGEDAGDVAWHAAGDAAPYSGTLADFVPRATPGEAPERRADGSRVYRAKLLPEVAQEVLPAHLRAVGSEWGTGSVGMTVKLDADGRLSSVTADLTPVLTKLHEQGVLSDVKRLSAAYQLRAFGEPVKAKAPSAGDGRVEDAGKVLSVIGSLEAGRCASTGGTGLGSRRIVRPVDCSGRHDFRVVDQVEVDRSFPGDVEVGNGDRYGMEACDRAGDHAPRDWRKGGTYAGAVTAVGESEVSVSVIMDGTGNGTTTQVKGSYTCLLTATD
ncbi:hypothetical protein AB0M42_19290 [Streptomyces sp. NPDC051784]|uniref:hypothetical protein n=1 Tax=Streptomyces sp. NPDC051784 TaxID=3155805 RepID=UPI00342E53C1